VEVVAIVQQVLDRKAAAVVAELVNKWQAKHPQISHLLLLLYAHKQPPKLLSVQILP
jgi:hypothetical protein